MKKLSVLLALVLILTVGVLPAVAITWGEADGDGHPNVGAIVVYSPVYETWVVGCSGTLVHEEVFLTAGHCTSYIAALIDAGVLDLEDDVKVSFDSEDALEPATMKDVEEIITHPAYNWGPTSNPHDVGVLILAEPVSGITPATLPEEGFLKGLKEARELRPGPEGTKFTVVGYGATLQWPPPQITPGDGMRRIAVSEYRALLKAWLVMSQNQATGDSGTCFGDSGGPAFWTDGETEILVGITSWGDMPCVATGIDYRVDIADTLDFIDEVISGLQ